jgi:hypothetical protein
LIIVGFEIAAVALLWTSGLTLTVALVVLRIALIVVIWFPWCVWPATRLDQEIHLAYTAAEQVQIPIHDYGILSSVCLRKLLRRSRLAADYASVLDYYVFPSIDIPSKQRHLLQSNAVNFDAYRFDSIDAINVLAQRSALPVAA